MGLYDQFVYTNFHELNADWLLAQMKAAKAKIDDFQAELDQFNTDYAALLALSSALTISGSNISTTKNFSAASLSGPLTGNVTGNLTGNVTGNVTGDVTGDLTGNVTGNVTGDVTGNLSGNVSGGTVTGTNITASNKLEAINQIKTSGYADIGTNLNVGNDMDVTGDASIGGDLTVTGSLIASVSAANANNIILGTSTDLDDYVPTGADLVGFYRTPTLSTHAPEPAEQYIVLGIRATIGRVQLAWCPAGSLYTYVRVKTGGAWQSWQKITTTTA